MYDLDDVPVIVIVDRVATYRHKYWIDFSCFNTIIALGFHISAQIFDQVFMFQHNDWIGLPCLDIIMELDSHVLSN